MSTDLLFATLDEPELNAVLEGVGSGGLPWSASHSKARIPLGSFGVLCKRQKSSSLQPLVLIAREDEYRRLFGRLAQIRNDFSPLTSWCHLLTPKQFEPFQELDRETDLGGLEAAWTGLSVAEALLLSDMEVSELKIAACLATLSYSIARHNALWQTPTREIIERYDTAHQMFRPKEPRTTRIRAAFETIWNVLSAASDYALSNHSNSLNPLVDAVTGLHQARLNEVGQDEAFRFFRSLSDIIPEAEILTRLAQLTPEQRVKEFDRVITMLGSDAAQRENSVYRHALAMLAGYISTVAAGGVASLSLLQPHARRWPEITGWAYVLGSLGQRVVWTSSFDGLGRLVARELMRTFRLDEAPTCDFALDEAAILFDSHLSDPFVHLRIKQARIATVSLAPGVNVPVPLREQSAEARSTDDDVKNRQSNNAGRSANLDMDALSEAIWRRLRGRIESHIETVSRRNLERNRSKRTSQQSKLPLKTPEDG